MLLRKKGFPEENEMVWCTVTKIHSNGVFANLDEYEDKSGLIHIPEVSPGRIRNLSDFVVEGKKIVCLVIRVDKERGHIDLSLRRVSESQKRKKIDSIKQQQKAEKILEFVAKKLNIDLIDLCKRVSEKVLENYENLYLFFEDVVAENASLEKLHLQPKEIKELDEVIKQRIKPEEIKLFASLNLISYASNGIEVIKDALKKIEDTNVEIKYSGGGKYNLVIKSHDYKEAEKRLEHIQKNLSSYMKDKEGIFNLVRE